MRRARTAGFVPTAVLTQSHTAFIGQLVLNCNTSCPIKAVCLKQAQLPRRRSYYACGVTDLASMTHGGTGRRNGAAHFAVGKSDFPTALGSEATCQNSEREARGEIYRFTVTKGQAGQRLDRVITSSFPGQSRSYFQALIDERFVRVNGVVAATKSRKAIEGEEVEVDFVTPERDLPLVAEDIPLDIIFEDEHLVIINKPAGMVVHPAPGNWTGTLVHALAHRYTNHLALGGGRPGIVHRLDKGTSGLIIAARTVAVHRQLTSMFANRDIEKTYLAITVGSPAGAGCKSVILDAPIGRSRSDRLKMAVVSADQGGRHARSIVEVVAEDTRRLLHVVRISLETGRTHQIRVHLRHARAPVLGDETYGALDVNKKYRSAATRPLLHASRLSLRHPVTGELIDVSAKLPKDMGELIQRNIYPGYSESDFSG